MAISLPVVSSLQSFTSSRRVRCDTVQNMMVRAENSALIVFTMYATCDGSLANCENRLAVSMKNGAPGGWPTSSL